MPNPLNVQLEAGPKGKKVVAVARDWPGLSRGASNEELAIQKLLAYVPRYAKVAGRAGLPFDVEAVEVVERYPGTGSTDFWGISFAFSEHDRGMPSQADLDRELALMQACWAEFDGILGRVSAELRKGPRGGGRDRDRIFRHVVANEHQWKPREAGLNRDDDIPLANGALHSHREAYVAVIRTLHAEGRTAGKWPLRFLIRHTAFHTMDHAWEMEDRDLRIGVGP